MELLLKKTQINGIVENRTFIYLVPALKEYGEIFKAKISCLPIKAFGVFDNDLKDLPHLEKRKCIYVLFDTDVQKSRTNSAINWMKNQEYFVDVVPYKSLGNPLNILIIDFPDNLSEIFDKFIEGKYSFMYTKEELTKFFSLSNPYHRKALGVLTKTKEAAQNHIETIQRDFETSITERELKVKGYQYDYPPRKKEEFFNY